MEEPEEIASWPRRVAYRLAAFLSVLKMVAAAALSANGLGARRGHVFGRELVLAAQGAATDVS